MRVHLHRATVDNAGRFVDAGVDIEVGDEAEQIPADRADQLLASGGAIDPDAPAEGVLELDAELHVHDLTVEHAADHGVDEFDVPDTGR